MKLRRIASLLVAVVLCTATGLPAMAEEASKKVLTVAFTELPGFFEYNEEREMVGYGIDYFRELSVHTGYRFVFVDVGAWENAFPALKSGEVDIVVPSTAPSDPDASPYIRTSAHIIENYMAVMALASSVELYYEDYETINSLKIAMTPSVQKADSVQTFFAERGLSPQLVLYETTDECKTALESGTVDAITSNIMDVEADYKTLAKFGYSDGLIAMLRGRDDELAVLNDALLTIQSNHPYFEPDLSTKWFSERAATPYTKQQAKLIESVGTFNVVVAPDRYPVTYMDESTGEFSGIAIDILDLLAQKTGLSFHYVSGGELASPFDSITDPDVDLVLTSLNEVDADEGTVSFVTNDILASDVNFATKNGASLPKDRNPVIAVPKSFRGLVSTLTREVPDIEILSFDTIEECIKAVRRGRADGIALDTYLMYELLNSPYYDDIKIIQSYSAELPYHIAATATVDVGFTIILNYGIARLSTDEINGIVDKYTTYEYYSPSIGEKIYASRQVICFFIAILLIFSLSIILWNRQKKKYTDALIKKNDDLVRATNAKSEFLSRMSHEIRTPMNAILGFSEIGLSAGTNAEVREAFTQIDESGKYLLGLINDILDMSRIENNKVVLHEEVIDSPAFFGTVVEMLQPLLQEKDMTLQTEFPHGDTRFVYCDKLRTRQIYLNLLNNAIKFSPKHSTVTWSVKDLEVKDGRQCFEIIVQDHGIGISEEFQKHLFEPFAREESGKAANVPGTGLGLAVVKNMVELMGGTITIQSQVGKGTKATVRLSHRIANGPEAAVIEPRQVDLTGVHVLLAEDHPTNTVIAKRLLENRGMRVTTAENGKLAVDLFSKSAEDTFDIILMDIRMPVMDGLTAAKTIRALDRSDAASVPIIAMTANAFAEDRELSIKAGMNAHLSKPFEAKTLYDTIEKHVRTNAARNAGDKTAASGSNET